MLYSRFLFLKTKKKDKIQCFEDLIQYLLRFYNPLRVQTLVSLPISESFFLYEEINSIFQFFNYFKSLIKDKIKRNI